MKEKLMNMDEVIFSDDMLISDVTVCTRQEEKYKDGVNKKVHIEASQDLVNNISTYLESRNFAVQKQSDSIPFLRGKASFVRLWDMDSIYRYTDRAYEVKIECKDFCRLVRYNGTGLPRKYVDKMLSYSTNGGKDIIICFQENAKFLTAYSKKHIITKIDAARILIDRKSLRIKKDGTFQFIPYGNYLHTLMKIENREIYAEGIRDDGKPRVPCSWDNFKGESQYIFNLDAMRTIMCLADDIVNNKVIL